MTGAARAARQNIVEGSSRGGTSRETELRLYDVAKGSLNELAGDFEAFLIEEKKIPWSVDDDRAMELKSMLLDRYEGDVCDNARHDYGIYICAMRKRFERWLEADDPIIAANSILIVIEQVCKLLYRQMKTIGDDFRENGGFTERLSKVRIEARESQIEQGNAPLCPICGKVMHKVLAQKGRNAGKPFWSCTAYPECNGTRSVG
ncbi:MAG: four helix bundle suffix domain-containing protein [Lentisphaeria bacterium]|nr:four helix bundle suffix domain-containing protein [Lentisphaeria bacterium]